jgi:hypothetical protein
VNAHRFRLVPLAATIAFVGLAGPALAYVCHPNGKGTRTTTVDGAVSRVALHGSTAVFVAMEGNRCNRVAWNTSAGAVRPAPVACSRFAGARRVASTALPAASTGAYRLTVAPGSAARPSLLRISAHGELMRALALPALPRTLVASGGLAVFSASRGEGLFAVRLTDGLYTYLAPDGGAFPALLGPRGVLFHDGESKLALGEGKTVLKFVPRATILRSIAKTASPFVAGGPIHAISMDGPRVALSVGDVRNVCDRVVYWNVAWRPVQRVSARSGPTCRPGRTGVGIDRLAIGGFRTEWLTSDRMLIAGSPLCQEWVLSRGGRIAAMAGDGGTLAFAVGHRVAIVDAHYRPRTIAVGARAPLALAADSRRVAILWRDGRVEVRSRHGRLLVTIAVAAGVRRIAIDGNTLVASGLPGVDLYAIRSGKRVAHRPLPAGATGLDVQFGIAAFARGREALVADTRTGQTAVVGRGSAPLVGVQIDGAGLAFAYGRVARFVPMEHLLRLLGR